MYALCAFVHYDRTVSVGDEFAVDDELVVLRPDLFSAEKPRGKRTSVPPVGE